MLVPKQELGTSQQPSRLTVQRPPCQNAVCRTFSLQSSALYNPDG